MKNQSLKTIQKLESRQRILNVASRLFRKQGFKATGIDQIMADAGLTAGAFYAHFKSKDELFQKSLEHALQHTRQLLNRDTENLTGSEKTEIILKRYCSVQHRDFPDMGCVLPSIASEIQRSSKKSGEVIAWYIQKWADTIVQNNSESISGDEKKEKALQLISRSVGAILLSRIVRETDLSEELLKACQKI